MDEEAEEEEKEEEEESEFIYPAVRYYKYGVTEISFFVIYLGN
jgi:hypothetical protein